MTRSSVRFRQAARSEEAPKPLLLLTAKTRQAKPTTNSQEIPAGFVDGDAVLDELLAEPGMRKAVDLIHEGTAHMDHVYAEGLAEIRQLAAQTQAGLAERMGAPLR